MKKLVFVLALASFLIVGCGGEDDEDDEAIIASPQPAVSIACSYPGCLYIVNTRGEICWRHEGVVIDPPSYRSQTVYTCPYCGEPIDNDSTHVCY